MARLIFGIIVAAILIFLSTTLPSKKDAVLPGDEAQKSARKTINKNKLSCNAGFHLKISLKSANGAQEWESGYLININRGGNGTAARLKDGKTGLVDAVACEEWRKNDWPILARALAGHQMTRRPYHRCANLAAVEFRVDDEKSKELICLLEPQKDRISADINAFLTSTARHIAMDQPDAGRQPAKSK